MGSSAPALVVGCAYPCEADEGAPDETMLTLFPNGNADGGVCGKPVYAYEDVGGREVEAEIRQGVSLARIIGGGHCLGKQGFIPILFNFWTGTELPEFTKSLCPPISHLIYLAHNVLPFITHHTLPPPPPLPQQPVLQLSSSLAPLRSYTHVLDFDQLPPCPYP